MDGAVFPRRDPLLHLLEVIAERGLGGGARPRTLAAGDVDDDGQAPGLAASGVGHRHGRGSALGAGRAAGVRHARGLILDRLHRHPQRQSHPGLAAGGRRQRAGTAHRAAVAAPPRACGDAGHVVRDRRPGAVHPHRAGGALHPGADGAPVGTGIGRQALPALGHGSSGLLMPAGNGQRAGQSRLVGGLATGGDLRAAGPGLRSECPDLSARVVVAAVRRALGRDRLRLWHRLHEQRSIDLLRGAFLPGTAAHGAALGADADPHDRRGGAHRPVRAYLARG